MVVLSDFDARPTRSGLGGFLIYNVDNCETTY